MKITRFLIKDNVCLVEIDNLKLVNLSSIQKVKPKLPLFYFKTEDGVNIYANNNGGYYVRLADWDLGHQKWWGSSCADHETLYKYFSTKEAAEQYILENKPISIALCNILDIVGEVSDNAKGYDNKSYLRSAFFNLFESKINP